MRSKVHYRRKHRAARAKYARRVAKEKSLPTAPNAASSRAATAIANTNAIFDAKNDPSLTANAIFAVQDVQRLLTNAIDCYFCGMKADAEFPPEQGGFDDFKKLAAHVLHCPWSPLPKPRTEFHIEAANLLAANRIADARMNGETTMSLPQPKQSGAPGTSGGSPTFPFLKVDNLTDQPREATITGVDTNGTGFNDIVVKIKMDGKGYFFGLKASNPCYKILFEKLGSDEERWIGRSFTLLQEWNTFYEKNFIGIGKVLPAEKTGKK